MLSKSNCKDIHYSDIPFDCQSCEARQCGVCCVLTPEQLTELSRHTQRTEHPVNTQLKTSNEEQETYANLLSGVVKLVRLMADGRQQIVSLQFAPDFLGRPYLPQTDIVAETATDVRICSFPKSVVERFIREIPEMEHQLHEQHMRELDEAREWILTLGRKTANEKVASFLLLIATHIDPEREDEEIIEIELPLKRADIADFLGLRVETVSRQFTKLQKQGILNINDRRRIEITDLAQLKYVAEDCVR